MDIHTDRAAAIRLLKALIAAGANSDTPMANAWIQAKALEAEGLEGEELMSALKYAGDQGWLDDGPRPGTILLTSSGERADA